MFSKELFGQRLCEIRKKNHETQTDLGNVLGLAKGRVSDMENGKIPRQLKTSSKFVSTIKYPLTICWACQIIRNRKNKQMNPSL